MTPLDLLQRPLLGTVRKGREAIWIEREGGPLSVMREGGPGEIGRSAHTLNLNTSEKSRNDCVLSGKGSNTTGER